MIDILTSLIDVCLIGAAWEIWRTQMRSAQTLKEYVRMLHSPIVKEFRSYEEGRRDLIRNMVKGALDRRDISSKVAEKFAERAFQIANAASLGVIALQKALAIPRPLTKPQGIANTLAKKEIDKLFNSNGGWEFMMPYMDEADREVIENLEKERAKKMNNGQ